LKKPIEIGCDNEAMLGLPYDPIIDLAPGKIENDFSKFHFAFVGGNWRSGKIKWEQKFYIPLDDPSNVKIYPENSQK
jgi:hypothetical protein